MNQLLCRLFSSLRKINGKQEKEQIARELQEQIQDKEKLQVEFVSVNEKLSQSSQQSDLQREALQKEMEDSKQNLQSEIEKSKKEREEIELKLKETKELLEREIASKTNPPEAQLSIEQDTSAESKNRKRYSTIPTPNEAYKDIITQYLNDNYKLEQEITELKKIYFHSIAVNAKLSLASSGVPSNVDIQSIFEKALVEKVSFNIWPKWISQQLSSQSNHKS